jgi:hypothetical protein
VGSRRVLCAVCVSHANYYSTLFTHSCLLVYEAGPSNSFSLQVLASHLYYRALLTIPSLIHSWVLDCKDRQLSSAVATYTSTNFSPLIIKAELAHVKSPESTSDLADENLTIKVTNLTNEVAASYLVDEHHLEIRLKIPTDWPLHRVEIKDVRPVGVDENRWRAWILAVQQTIWAQVGVSSFPCGRLLMVAQFCRMATLLTD